MAANALFEVNLHHFEQEIPWDVLEEYHTITGTTDLFQLDAHKRS